MYKVIVARDQKGHFVWAAWPGNERIAELAKDPNVEVIFEVEDPSYEQALEKARKECQKRGITGVAGISSKP